MREFILIRNISADIGGFTVKRYKGEIASFIKLEKTSCTLNAARSVGFVYVTLR